MTDARSLNTAPSITRLKDYEPYPYVIADVDLTFKLHPTETRVTQRSQVRRIIQGVTSIELNGKDLTRVSINIAGVEVSDDR
ncbi:MAG: hypothetical protein ISP87_03870, partial [Litoricola sp.]|nr:hypothetical protein [Litorivicinus sp.]